MNKGGFMDNFKFLVLTDPHFFDTDLGCSGEAYEDFMHYEQKCFAETESINKSVFNFLNGTDLADTVLIVGDLTQNGERKSHEKFIKLLYELKENGKKVYLITADHDWKGDPFAFGENGRYQPEPTPKEELIKLYNDFGFSDAIAVDEEHLSYVAQLADGVRLLAINADIKTKGQFSLTEKQVEWIKEQTKKAREENQTMFAICHYPVLPIQPVFSIIKSALMYDYKAVATLLADEGVHMVFTGHMHNQSINEFVTEKGNKLYDITTGSIIADPSYIRLVTLGENKAEIESIATPDFEWDTKGMTCKEYLTSVFDAMIRNIILDLRDDTTRAMRKFHIKESKGLVFALRMVGKLLCSIKLGTLARLLFIKCDESIRKVKLIDYATVLVRNVFRGNQTYNEGTPEGDVFIAFLKRMNPILKKISVKDPYGEKADLAELLKNTAGNYGYDDYNTKIEW